MSIITNLTDNEAKFLGAAISFTAAGASLFAGLFASAKVYNITTTLLVKGLMMTGTIKVA